MKAVIFVAQQIKVGGALSMSLAPGIQVPANEDFSFYTHSLPLLQPSYTTFLTRSLLFNHPTLPFSLAHSVSTIPHYLSHSLTPFQPSHTTFLTRSLLFNHPTLPFSLAHSVSTIPHYLSSCDLRALQHS